MEYLSLTEEIYDKIRFGLGMAQIIKYDFGVTQNIYVNHSEEYIHYLCLSDIS